MCGIFYNLTLKFISMRNLLLLIFVVVLMSSCKDNVKTENSETEISASDNDALSEMNWLLGVWTNEADGMFSKETWSRKDGSTFTGFSSRLMGKDTVFSEKMTLQQKGDDVVLTVTTVEQNKEDSVNFKLVSSTDNEFVFENKKHDFPQRIAYKRQGDDSIHAWIDGSVLGEKKKIDFYFFRKK